MNPAMNDTTAASPKKPNQLIELLVNIVIPSVILMKFSGPEDLGAVNALLLALAFPLFWGARDLVTRRKSTCSPLWAWSAFCLPAASACCNSTRNGWRSRKQPFPD